MQVALIPITKVGKRYFIYNKYFGYIFKLTNVWQMKAAGDGKKKTLHVFVAEVGGMNFATDGIERRGWWIKGSNTQASDWRQTEPRNNL